MKSCIFCKIMSGEIPSNKLYEDDDFIIINDISPRASLHYLAIPKNHYPLIENASSKDAEILGKIFKKIAGLKQLLKLEDGYRLTINQGENAGQSVHHLHIHIMSGQHLPFPDFRV